MLTKVENPKIITKAEARELYADKWFCYILLDKEEVLMYKSPEETMVRVLYLADSKKELASLPIDERRIEGFPDGGIEWGVKINPEPGIHIGGLRIG